MYIVHIQRNQCTVYSTVDPLQDYTRTFHRYLHKKLAYKGTNTAGQPCRLRKVTHIPAVAGMLKRDDVEGRLIQY